MSTKAKIAVIYYSTYGHITKLTEEVVAGAKATGAEVTLYQVPETLSKEILEKQYAIPRPDIPEIGPHDLPNFDGFIFGFPTRYGRAPAQVSAFFDATGKEWASGALVGKFATVYTSAASQHGGLESTQLTTMPFFMHHGISYVPSGFASSELTKLDEIIGGSAYGAGTIAGGDGSRQPTEADLAVARAQGKHFSTIVNTFVAGKHAIAAYESQGASTTTAAQALPASAAAPAMYTTSGPAGAKEGGYTVDSAAPAAAATGATADPATAGSGNGTDNAPNTNTASMQPAPTGAAASKPPRANFEALAGEKHNTVHNNTAAISGQKKKKRGIFAGCCGKEDDYTK